MEDNEVHLLNAKPDVVHETAPPKSRWSRLQRALPLWVAFLVSCWWLAAIGVTLIMKQTVGSDAAIFPFPIMLTGLTNAFTGILAFQSGRMGLLALRSASMPPLKSAERIKLLAIGLMMGIEIAATNKSLEFLTVSERTMMNSTSVLFMLATAWFWGLEPFGMLRLLAIFLLILGALLQHFDHSPSSSNVPNRSPSMHMLGVVLQLVALTVSAQRWALVQVVTQRSLPGSALEQMSKSKLHMVARILPVTAFVCFILALVFESPSLPWIEVPKMAVTILLMSLGIATLTMAELELVRVTSAVAFQVLAVLHNVPLVLASVFLFGDRFGAGSVGGFILCSAGALVYARVRHIEASKLDRCSGTILAEAGKEGLPAGQQQLTSMRFLRRIGADT